MNPDLLKKLKELFVSPPDTARPRQLNPAERLTERAMADSAIRNMFTGQSADSLYQLVGLPQRLDTDRMPGAYGTYNRGSHALTVSNFPEVDGGGYADEPGAAFRLDRIQWSPDATRRTQWVPDTTVAGRRRGVLAHEMGHHARQMLNNQQRSDILPKISEESRADLFGKVFDMLSKTGTASTDSVARSLDRLNRQFNYGEPATEMARFIAERPSNVFAGHPVKKLLGIK